MKIYIHNPTGREKKFREYIEKGIEFSPTIYQENPNDYTNKITLPGIYTEIEIDLSTLSQLERTYLSKITALDTTGFTFIIDEIFLKNLPEISQEAVLAELTRMSKEDTFLTDKDINEIIGVESKGNVIKQDNTTFGSFTTNDVLNKDINKAFDDLEAHFIKLDQILKDTSIVKRQNIDKGIQVHKAIENIDKNNSVIKKKKWYQKLFSL